MQILGAGILGFLLLRLFIARDNFAADLLISAFASFVAVVIVVSLTDQVKKRALSPISLVVSFLIANAIILVHALMSSWFLYSLGFDSQSGGFVSSILSFFYNLVLFLLVGYVLVILRELFFLRQRRKVNTYYNVMLVFMLLAGFFAFLNKYTSWNFVSQALEIVAYILIGLNSLKISWIAFLKKKQKTTLLLLAVVSGIIFGVNIAIAFVSDQENLVKYFSDSANIFYRLVLIYGLVYSVILFFTTLFHLPTADAFDRKAKEISSLQNFSKLIHQVFDEKELLETVTSLSAEISHADASWVFLTSRENHIPALPFNTTGGNASKISAFCTNQLKTAETAGVYHLPLAECCKLEAPGMKFHTAVVVPVNSYNHLLGYIFVLFRQEVVLDEEDKAALETFADYAAIALENSNLLRESIEKERMEKELDVAREMQRKLLPQSKPDISGVEIASVFVPAFEVGGDYYDFFEIQGNKMGFTIADVSGKGISASFIMAEIRGIFASLTQQLNAPHDILRFANESLKRSLDRKNFITAIFGILDPATGVVEIARAGHTPMLHFDGETVHEILPKGIGLGLNYSGIFEGTLERQTLQLKENELIILFTDGISEAQNSENEIFGTEAIKKIVAEHAAAPTDEIAQKIMGAVSLFCENNPQHDDITLVIFRWKNKNYGVKNG